MKNECLFMGLLHKLAENLLLILRERYSNFLPLTQTRRLIHGTKTSNVVPIAQEVHKEHFL